MASVAPVVTLPAYDGRRCSGQRPNRRRSSERPSAGMSRRATAREFAAPSHGLHAGRVHERHLDHAHRRLAVAVVREGGFDAVGAGQPVVGASGRRQRLELRPLDVGAVTLAIGGKLRIADEPVGAIVEHDHGQRNVARAPQSRVRGPTSACHRPRRPRRRAARALQARPRWLSAGHSPWTGNWSAR